MVQMHIRDRTLKEHERIYSYMSIFIHACAWFFWKVVMRNPTMQTIYNLRTQYPIKLHVTLWHCVGWLFVVDRSSGLIMKFLGSIISFCTTSLSVHVLYIDSLTARFMGPTWGPSGTDRTQVGPMLAPWTLLSGALLLRKRCGYHHIYMMSPGWCSHVHGYVNYWLTYSLTAIDDRTYINARVVEYIVHVDWNVTRLFQGYGCDH